MVPAVRAVSGPLNWMNVSPGWAGWAQCLPIFLVPLEFLLSTLGHLPPATLIRPTHHRCTTSTNIFIKFSVFIFGLSAAKNGFSENYTQLKIINRLSSLLLCTQLLQETFLSTKYYDCFIVIIHFTECKLRSGSKLAPTFWHSVYWISICQGLVKITWHLHFTYILYILYH